jgi:hypothetical protein
VGTNALEPVLDSYISLVLINWLVVFLFHIKLICLLERERGLQGCKPRSLL